MSGEMNVKKKGKTSLAKPHSLQLNILHSLVACVFNNVTSVTILVLQPWIQTQTSILFIYLFFLQRCLLR